jgi:hypothetical protein
MLFGCWIGLQDLFCISLAPDSFGLTLAVLNSKSVSANHAALQLSLEIVLEAKNQQNH